MLKIIQNHPATPPERSGNGPRELLETRRHPSTGTRGSFPVLAKTLRAAREAQTRRHARAQRQRWAVLIGSAVLILLAAGLVASLWALIHPIVSSPFYPS